MRRLYAAIVLSACFQLAVPVRAYALWDWLDRLSGPGRFWGPAVETRLVCMTKKPDDDKINFVVGIIGSACVQKLEEVRQASIDLGVRFLTAQPNPLYAGGHEIKLTILEPSFSWRVASWLDAGTGVGVYWISSEGFKSLRGVTLEPLRLDFHFSRTLKPDDDGWFRSIPIIRVGAIIFPAGFDANTFAAPDTQGARRIPAELRLHAELLLDLDPIFRYARRPK